MLNQYILIFALNFIQSHFKFL